MAEVRSEIRAMKDLTDPPSVETRNRARGYARDYFDPGPRPRVFPIDCGEEGTGIGLETSDCKVSICPNFGAIAAIKR